MPTLEPRFNFGQPDKNTNPTLYNQLNDLYSAVANNVNLKSGRFIAVFDPLTLTTVNATLSVGDLWINSATDMAWIMTSRTTSTNVTWKLIT